MSTTANPQQPVVPPRPSRSQDRDQIPKIPPRPLKSRIDRSISPNPDRFAPSPLNEEFLHQGHRSTRFSPTKLHLPADPIKRAGSVDMPSVGEEGIEYAAVAEELGQSRRESSSPEQTRTIGEDIKLHAPKPSLPAVSAKQRVATVTRTDSDRAASFGIGRPSSEEVHPSNRSLKKKASTASQLSTTTESHIDDDHGIPEIGLQVPMYRDAGDVQAPSPAPNSEAAPKRHHARKTSSRGLPPGSYGLHGHGVVSNDKLDKAYYQKHPSELKKERHLHHHDRPNDFSMSSDDLNRIVRDTHSRGLGLGTRDLTGTPSEQVGWQAIDESASRLNSPRPTSTGPNTESKSARPATATSESGDHVIHVDERGHRRSVMFSDSESVHLEDFDDRTETPILAADELAKDPGAYDHLPAVEPPRERRGSAYEMEEPSSRPSSRPASLYKVPSSEVRSTPLEDVVEYEPLFDEDEKTRKSTKKKFEEYKARFPSKDIWEEPPSSVHYTAEVSTPDVPEEQEGESPTEKILDIPPRDGETPSQAFARHQEELARKEFNEDPEGHLHRTQKPNWLQHQPHLAKEVKPAESRPAIKRGFPSRDVWEDTPDSLKLETTVSTPQQDDEEQPASSTTEAKPEIPQRPARKPADLSPVAAEKPALPERPKPKQTPSEERLGDRPPVSDRPKPQIPPRPVKQGSGSSTDKDAEAAAPAVPRAKPAVPARPVGGKIAALQAGFMSDLNKRLQLGPQAPPSSKKEEERAEGDKEEQEQKEKVPLSDARKGRARGPQRRAPARSPAAAPAAPAGVVKLGFSTTVTMFAIDPEDEEGRVRVEGVTGEEGGEQEKERAQSGGTTADAPPAAAAAASEKEKEKKTEVEVSPSVQEPEDVAVGQQAAVPAAASVTGPAATEKLGEGEVEREEDEEEVDQAPTVATSAPVEEKTETLATNTAGETLLETKVEEDKEEATVVPKGVEEVAKE